MRPTGRPVDGLYKCLDETGEGGESFFPHTKKQLQVHDRRGRRERNFPYGGLEVSIPATRSDHPGFNSRPRPGASPQSCLMGDRLQTRVTGAFALFCEQIALLLTKNVSIAQKPMS